MIEITRDFILVTF